MTEVLQFPFRGVEEGVDPKALPPGTLLKAENCAMDKARRLCKRAGTSSLVRTIIGGGSLSTGTRLIPLGDSICQVNATSASAYSTELASWQTLARPPNLYVTRRPFADATRSTSAVDTALSGSMLVTLYASGYTSASGERLYVRVENLQTGRQVLAPILLSTVGAFPRVRIDGGVAYLTFWEGGSIFVNKLNLTTFALDTNAGVPIVTDADATPAPLDAVIATAADGTRLYVAYAMSAGTNRLKVFSVLAATLGTLASVTVATTSADVNAVAMAATANGIAVAYSVAAVATRLVSFTPALVVDVGPTDIYAGASSQVILATSGSDLFVGWVRNDANNLFLEASRLTTCLRAAATHVLNAASVRITFHVNWVGAPWLANSRWYLMASVTPRGSSFAAPNEAIPGASVVVVEAETANSISSVTDGPHHHAATLEANTGWTASRLAFVPSPVTSGSDVYVAAPYRNREPYGFFEQNVMPIGWNLHKLQTSTADLHRLARVGAGSLGAAGAPFWHDGTGLNAYAFVHAPMIADIVVTAGGSMVAGRYTYVAVYEWRDQFGVTHRSAPSPPRFGDTAGGNLSLTLTINSSSLSHKLNYAETYGANYPSAPVTIAIYRTTINGDRYYRLSLEPTSNRCENVATAATVSFVDTRADANIAAETGTVTLSAQPQLYTSSGEVDDIMPPSFITVTTHRGRLVGIGPDLRTVWFSKDSTVDTTLAPGFNEALTLAFASDKTALASLDDKLVVFGESTIDMVFGDGPDDAGQNNTWQIAAVQTDVGCVNPRSVVTAPMGTIFESSRGLEMLGRDMTISWIGESIEDTLASFPTITSAVLVPDEQEVRFTCNATGGATGIVLAWNYAYKVWFTRKYADLANTSAASIPFADAALIDGVYTMLTAGGQVYQETTAHKLDNGTGFVARDVILAPISPSGNQSWHRVKQVSLLGTSVTNHDLAVSIARDYATSYEQTSTFLAGSTATTIGPLEQCRVTLANQKCQAVKIRIQDTTPTTPASYPVSTGDGPIFEAVALRVGPKSGTPRTAAGQQR